MVMWWEKISIVNIFVLFISIPHIVGGSSLSRQTPASIQLDFEDFVQRAGRPFPPFRDPLGPGPLQRPFSGPPSHIPGPLQRPFPGPPPFSPKPFKPHGQRVPDNRRPPFAPAPPKEHFHGPSGNPRRPQTKDMLFTGRPHTGPPPHPPLPNPSVGKIPEKEYNDGPGGCNTKEGFRFAGEVWYANGCRRRKCIHFRGSFFTETDACDTEIYNTTYKCIIEVDTNAQYPHCCPKYRCNPDNLGNSVK